MSARAPESPLALDRRTAPAPGEPRPLRFPVFERRQLENGLTLVVARRTSAPLACLQWVFEAGGEHDPHGQSGLASLTAGMIDEGTETRSGPEIAAFTERLGGSLSTEASWDDSTASLFVQSGHWREALGLLAELATEANLPTEELERSRRQRLTELLRRRDSPAVAADLALMRCLYGRAAYGHSILGDEASVKSLTRSHVESFYRRHYNLGNATLVATGDVEADPLADALERALARRPVSARSTPEPVQGLDPEAPARRRIQIIDRPQAAQTELRVGQVGLPRKHPDFLAFRVMTTVLGGKFTSRLNLNLRERHGFTYGVTSSLPSRRGPAPLAISTAVSNGVVAASCHEIFGELERMRRELMPPEELAQTIQYLMGVFPFGLQTIEALASRLTELVVHALPDNHFELTFRRWAELRVEEVLESCQRHLQPQLMSIVAVGPASVLAPQLAPLGAVEVTTAS